MSNNDKFLLFPKQVSMEFASGQSTGWFGRFNLDFSLVAAIAMLFAISLLALYSTKQDILIVEKQGLRMLLALALMAVVAQIPPRVLQNWTAVVYLFGLIILLLVFGIGISSKGARRWLELGLVRFQPAELMKLAVPMMVAKILHEHVLPPSFKVLVFTGICIFLPSFLVAAQPDLGTAILIASGGCLVVFFAGIKWRQLGFIVLSSIVALPLFWSLLKDYQKARVLTLFNPEQDPLGKGYQIIQSKIAIGSGGIYGKGWLNGTQGHLEYLPERTTDFIFAVFGEEFGLLGALLLLGIYTFIVVRGLYIGSKAQDTFNRLLAGSIAMMFFVYVFVNIGMVCGILPVVGVPLPLVSYGGTSLVTLMISLGILMSINSHRILLKK